MPTIRLALAAVLVTASVLASSALRADDAGREAELLAVLRSEKPEADKALACKGLAVHGSAAAVPDLAKLLDNERLASWARIPLEAIPDTACDAALRDAAGRLSGKLLVGVVNSLGVRRDAAAVDLLAKLALDPEQDTAVAGSAAIALGKIGSVAAAAPLGTALASPAAPVRLAAAEGCVLCGEHLLAAGKTAEAVALFEAVRKADVPARRKHEATRALILARGAGGVPLLLELLSADDRDSRNMGLGVARELPGVEADTALAALLGTANPNLRPLLVEALADRGGAIVRAAIAQAAAKGEREVRLPAVRALGRVGDAGSLAPLLELAVGDDADLAAAAADAIAALPGTGIDAAIGRQIPSASGKKLVMLLNLAAQRRIDVLPQVLEAVQSPDAAVHAAALATLGEIVDLERLPVLVQQAVKPRDEADAAAALKALKTACVRMPDRDRCAAALAGAVDDAPAATKVALLDVIGEVGGGRALEAVAAAARSGDEKLQDAGTRLLGAWMTADAGPVLLELAKTMPQGKFQDRAFRGFLRIARQLGGTPDQKAALCRQAFAAARDADEKLFVLEAIRSVPAADTLTLAVEAGAAAEFREAARVAAADILTKTGDSIPGGWEKAASLGVNRLKIEIVSATYGAGDVQRDVSDAVRKRVGPTPLIPMPSPAYNTCFGGDPAPGTAKKLTIRYTIDGKAGEASFAEDAPIVLPLP
jgi:HEAT repeat protein